MNSNPGIQNNATVAWDGTTHRPGDISKHVNFGWSFEVIAALGADTIFKVQSAPPSVGDPCVPGAWTDVQRVPVCMSPLVAGVAQFTLPAGTPIGTVCAGTIPCRPDKFVRLQSVSGEPADVRAVLIRQGPMI